MGLSPHPSQDCPTLLDLEVMDLFIHLNVCHVWQCECYVTVCIVGEPPAPTLPATHTGLENVSSLQPPRLLQPLLCPAICLKLFIVYIEIFASIFQNFLLLLQTYQTLHICSTIYNSLLKLALNTSREDNILKVLHKTSPCCPHHSCLNKSFICLLTGVNISGNSFNNSGLDFRKQLIVFRTSFMRTFQC